MFMKSVLKFGMCNIEVMFFRLMRFVMFYILYYIVKIKFKYFLNVIFNKYKLFNFIMCNCFFYIVKFNKSDYI